MALSTMSATPCAARHVEAGVRESAGGRAECRRPWPNPVMSAVVGSLPRSACCGGCAPTPHPGASSALRGSGPPTQPSDFLSVGAAPPRPHPERRAAPPPDRARAPEAPRVAIAHRQLAPRPLRCPPSPLAGEGGGEGVRAQPAAAYHAAPAVGAAPPTPPSRMSALRGSGPPTRPRIFFHVGAAPPRPHSERRAAPPPDRAPEAPRQPTPEAPPTPSPLAGEGGGEGVRATPARPASACGGTPQPTRHNPPPGNAASRPRVDRRGGVWGGAPP